jgi:hypothetical protein
LQEKVVDGEWGAAEQWIFLFQQIERQISRNPRTQFSQEKEKGIQKILTNHAKKSIERMFKETVSQDFCTLFFTNQS